LQRFLAKSKWLLNESNSVYSLVSFIHWILQLYDLLMCFYIFIWCVQKRILFFWKYKKDSRKIQLEFYDVLIKFK
jgi:hypothetical protein